MACKCSSGGGCDCNGQQAEGWTLTSFDTRQVFVQAVRAHGQPVVGATLGGGFSGSNIGSGVGRIGGGTTPPVTHAASGDPIAPFPGARVDFHFDYSTPGLIFERDPDAAMYRELGGLQGGERW